MVDIAVLLGKRLKENHITIEFMSRIGELERLINQSIIIPEKIILTGGKRIGNNKFSEAGLAKDYLESDSVCNILKGKIVIDREARNTIENIENVLKELEEYKGDILLHIISTDYHIKRMEKIEELMPNTEILLTSLKKRGISYKCWASEYIYNSNKNPITKWCSELYLISDDLRIIETNLEAIASGKEKKLFSRVINNFPDYIDDFDVKLIKGLEYRNTQKGAIEKIIEIIDIIHPKLTNLRKYSDNLKKFTLDTELQNKNETDEIKKIYIPFHDEIESISISVDPDEPAPFYNKKQDKINLSMKI